MERSDCGCMSVGELALADFSSDLSVVKREPTPQVILALRRYCDSQITSKMAISSLKEARARQVSQVLDKPKDSVGSTKSRPGEKCLFGWWEDGINS